MFLRVLQTVILYLAFAIAPALGRYTGPINQAGLELIKRFEGFKSNFYIDSVGIKTIGYGHACHVWNCNVPINGKYSVPLSMESGEELLKSDLRRYEDCVKDTISYSDLSANQFASLVSFAFNLGCGNLRSSTLRKLLNKGNVIGASKEFSKWNKAGGRVLNGLVYRRRSEMELFCSGENCSIGMDSDKPQCIGKTTTTLNIRDSPSTSSRIKGTLAHRQSVTITDRVLGMNGGLRSFWFRIGEGYVSSSYIRITSSNGHSWCSTSIS